MSAPPEGTLRYEVVKERQRRRTRLAWGMWGGMIMALCFAAATGSIWYRLPSSGELGHVALCMALVSTISTAAISIYSGYLIEKHQLEDP